MIRFIAIIHLFPFLLTENSVVYAQDPVQKYAVLIAGLGGTPGHKTKFQNYLVETQNALIENFGFPEANMVTLAAPPTDKEAFVNGVSRAEVISEEFQKLSAKVTPQDDVFIILFGHGSFDGKNAMLNIPRRDLKDIDYAIRIDSINARRVIFINTASCSGPFIKQLSAKNRIIITATKSGRERIDTQFPAFFIEALTNNAADLNKNGDLSILEVFKYASEATANWYAEKNHLATEHALLDDTGDSKGHQFIELDASPEGSLSGTVFLKTASGLLAANTSNPDAVALFADRQKIEEEIQEIQEMKTSLTEDDYFSKLEPLFIKLALINADIEQPAKNKN